MFDRKAYKKKYDKEYRKENKESKKEYEKKYYQKNRDRLLMKQKEYYKNNQDKIKKYLKKNRDRILNRSKEKYKNNLKSWESFIPSKTHCRICGREIYFRHRKNFISFDHKDENTPIKVQPTEWLSHQKMTPNRLKIWKECDFGILCNRCNAFLPTKNRPQFIINVIKYVFKGKARIQFLMKVLKDFKDTEAPQTPEEFDRDLL